MRRAALLVASIACGCEVTPTQLVVVVSTDMNVPTQLDAFEIVVEGADGRTPSVEGAGRARYGAPIAIEGDVQLPASFGVAPHDGDEDRRVTVRVAARRAGQELFETRAVTSFVDGEQLRLDMFLAKGCIDEECEPEQTCTRLGCVDPEIDPDDLPGWDGVLPVLDGGTDAGPSDDAWPRVIAWTEDDDALQVSDVVVRDDGTILVFGQLSGTATLEGAPEGAQEVTQFGRIWRACFTREGEPCGLLILGSGSGFCFAPEASLDATGRLYVFGGFFGEMDLGTGRIDDGTLDGAVFLMREELDATLDVAVLRGGPDLIPGTFVPLEGGGSLMSVWGPNGQLFVEPFGRAAQYGPGNASLVPQIFAMRFDEDLGLLGVTPYVTATETMLAAGARFGGHARVFSRVDDDALDGHIEGVTAVEDVVGLFSSGSNCKVFAAAASEDGTIAIACSVDELVESFGDRIPAPDDVWLAGYAGSETAPSSEALWGGTAIEIVNDGVGGVDSTMVWVGNYSEGAAQLGGVLLPAATVIDGVLFGTRIEDGEFVVDWMDVVQSAGTDEAIAVARDAVDGAIVATGTIGGTATIRETLVDEPPGRKQIWLDRFLP